MCAGATWFIQGCCAGANSAPYIWGVLSYMAAWLGTFVQGPIVSYKVHQTWD